MSGIKEDIQPTRSLKCKRMKAHAMCHFFGKLFLKAEPGCWLARNERKQNVVT